MNVIYTWWDDAVTAANDIATQTQLRHRVSAVHNLDGGVVGWLVDLADGEHRRASTAVDETFWQLVAPILPTTTEVTP